MESFPMAVWGTMEPCLEVSGGFQALIKTTQSQGSILHPANPSNPPVLFACFERNHWDHWRQRSIHLDPPKTAVPFFFSRSVGRRHQSRLKAPRALVLCSGGPFSLPKALPERSGSRLGALRLQDLRRIVGSVGQGVRWQIGSDRYQIGIGIWGKGVEHGQLLRCFQPT